MKRLKICLDRKETSFNYDIVIGTDILCQLGEYVKSLNIGDDIFIITDKRVARLYLRKAIDSFIDAGFRNIDSAQLKEGEQSKTYQNYISLIERLLRFDRYMKKRIIIITLGGGVVGDLGGFVAATYKRGIDYIQVPTTLLGQVDCGLGGKVAINLGDAKNLVGAFWQPRLVLMDMDALKTLDRREIGSGLAEAIKYGMIKDEKLFEYLEKHLEDVLSLTSTAIEHIISCSVGIKADIVEADEFDRKGIRIMLNFGHTIGHAIETASGYKYYRHGEAVAVGMLCAADISNRLGLLKESVYTRLENLIKGVGLPVTISRCSLQGILNAMRYDKKFIGGKNRFVLPVRIGKTVVKEGIDETLIKEALQNFIYVSKTD